MKDRIKELMDKRPELQFSRNGNTAKAMSLFGNTSNFCIGMGMGNKLGGQPTFMNCKSRFGYGNFMHARGG